MSSVTGDVIDTPNAKRRGLVATRDWSVIVTLSLLILIGFGLRMREAGRIGFAEDEINKLEAVQAYARGDIRPNAEHPMLMKALMFVSMRAANAWNASSDSDISDEAALRSPNILFGALTVIPLFLLTAAFFDRRTAFIASMLWTFGINAITYSRIAKEDTLLVFFLLFGFYFFLRAKQTTGFDPKGKRRNYILSGASFGLMLASKYFPHYFGLNMLYYHWFKVREREPNEPPGKTPLLFYILIGLVFIIVNPAVLLPQTWNYLNAYSSEQLLTHTGYLMGDQLYRNNVSSSPFWGTPLYFYALFLLIKVPLPVLFAFIAGLVQCVRRRRHPGHQFLLMMFILWIVPYSLFGAKWLRYTLSLMPLVYMIAAVGIVALMNWSIALLKRTGTAYAKPLTSAVMLLIFVAAPAWTAYANGPHYAAYTNALGKGRAGVFFPHDEFYDDGLREAIQYVSEHAPQGATIVHETPGVVRYYLQKFGRTDLNTRVLSDKNLKVDQLRGPTFIILQRGRTYFENREKMTAVRATFQKIAEETVHDASAAEVYYHE